jgi:hypothetical protein
MRRAGAVTVVIALLSAPTAAHASGSWVAPVLGGSGITAPGSQSNLIAVPVGPNTVVERVRRGSGGVQAIRLVRGSFGIPGAAQDGSTTGLSADGRTLVIAGLPHIYPPERTQLVVLDAKSLHVGARITLPGFFSVDAIDPTGRWLYLTDYLSSSNGIQYEVRAYDLVSRRLLARPIVDPRHPREKMLGIPLTRTMGGDGRWVYTLYQSFQGAPFIHALDTGGRRAFCVDLPMLKEVGGASARLILMSATALGVVSNGKVVALMDTRTLAVHLPLPAKPIPKTHAAARESGGDGGLRWVLGIGLVASLAVLIGLVRRRRRTALGRVHPELGKRTAPQ